MMEFWVRFAQAGGPNGGSLPHWPAMTPQVISTTSLATRSQVASPTVRFYLDFVHSFLTGAAAEPQGRSVR
jgi:carboxylesterase type B